MSCINLSSTAGALGAEKIELRNSLLCFKCVSEELRVVVARLDAWIANPPPPPPWSTCCALMSCRLVALDKRPGVHPVGLVETLCRALAKLAMRAAREQEKTACGYLHLCAGLKAGIEGATNAVGQRIIDRSRDRRREDNAETSDV